MMIPTATRAILRTFGGVRTFNSLKYNRCCSTTQLLCQRAISDSLIKTRWQSSHNSQQRNSPPLNPMMFCFGGILSFFGFEQPKKDDAIVDTIKRGILALRRKEYNKAERLLHIALKLSQDVLNESAETYCIDVLANIAYERGDYPKAEKLFVDVMKRVIANGTPMDDNAIVEMSLKIATMSGRQGSHDKAEQGFKFCIDAQRKKTAGALASDKLEGIDKDNFLLLGLSMDYYADYLLSSKRYSEARQMFKEALAISQTCLGPEHEQTLVIACNLALTYERLGEVKQSVEILEGLVSMKGIENSEDLPIFLCNLAMNYTSLRKFSEAEEALEKARRLATILKDEAVLKEVTEYLQILRTERAEKA